MRVVEVFRWCRESTSNFMVPRQFDYQSRRALRWDKIEMITADTVITTNHPIYNNNLSMPEEPEDRHCVESVPVRFLTQQNITSSRLNGTSFNETFIISIFKFLISAFFASLERDSPLVRGLDHTSLLLSLSRQVVFVPDITDYRIISGSEHSSRAWVCQECQEIKRLNYHWYRSDKNIRTSVSMNVIIWIA